MATHPGLLKTLALVAGLATLIPSLLLSVILGAQGDWAELPPLLGVFALVGVGLFVGFVLIALIVFGNRQRTRYTLDEGGVTQETLDRPSGLLSRLAVLAGAATATDVKHRLTVIRQDQPVPSLDALHRVASINPGCAAFEGFMLPRVERTLRA
ncbi:hypothetical protein [Halochromatium salexigens]|uniref:Uncharacterized protein n=1 Tax=Halochromatium salexigens TaxID=49447 RepID=A0AAJ0UEQ7_HALSE|nr:hypothetical protein [Halochromatium salexigens]MBK5929976.1 hypothetical protein [Halochromatium salexigens]